MKTKKCGLYAALAAVLLITAGLITNCTDPLSLGGLKIPEDKFADFKPPEGMGYIRFNFDDINLKGSRTVMPAAVYLAAANFETIEVIITGVTPTNNETVSDWDGSPIAVNADTYTVQVIGYNDDAVPVAVAFGEEEDVEVTAGSGTPVTVTLKEIVDGTGKGTFNWNLANSGTVTSATMKIIGLSAGAESTYDSGYTGTASGATGNLVADAELIGSVELDSGYYRMEIVLVKADHKSATIREVAHIWNGHTTRYPLAGTKALVLNSNLHRVTYTFNDLRPSATTATKDFVHNAAFTHPGTGAGTEPVYTLADGTTTASRGFLGWFETASGTAKQWTIAMPVIRPQTLYARWSAPPTNITITLDFEYTVDPGFSFAAQDITDPLTPVNITLSTYTLDQDDPPIIRITLSGASGTTTYNWVYDNDISEPAPSLGATNALTLNFGSNPEYLIPGTHSFTVYVTIDGADYSNNVTITVGTPTP